MDPLVLTSRLAALRSLAASVPASPPPDAVDRFCQALVSQPPEALDRIAPFDLAGSLRLPRGLVVDLCLLATRAGLLELSYHLFCFGCGAAEYTFGELDQVLSGSYFCTICRRERPADLDDRVEVVFRPCAALGWTRPDPYADLASYERRYFSPHLRFAGPVATALAAGWRDFVAVEPGGVATRRMTLAPGQAIQALSLDAHAVAHVEARDRTRDGGRDVTIELLPEGLAAPDQAAPSGPISLHLHNRRDRTIGFILRCVDWEQVSALYRQHPPTIAPFLSARDLLAHQRFTELFGATARVPDLRLQIRHLTVLFTDLQGSTRFYEARGDVAAYAVIREHFTLLTEVVRRHAGAVVKTMGDAIMAVFTDPGDAVGAALAMHEVWRPRVADGLPGLKLGVHAGPAVVVNADGRFDYFGRTVNLAAAVESLADADELWATGAVVGFPGVLDLLDAKGCDVEARSVRLKGQPSPSAVHRIVSPGSHRRPGDRPAVEADDPIDRPTRAGDGEAGPTSAEPPKS